LRGIRSAAAAAAFLTPPLCCHHKLWRYGGRVYTYLLYACMVSSLDMHAKRSTDLEIIVIYTACMNPKSELRKGLQCFNTAVSSIDVLSNDTDQPYGTSHLSSQVHVLTACNRQYTARTCALRNMLYDGKSTGATRIISTFDNAQT
jgi:hypothetical protein